MTTVAHRFVAPMLPAGAATTSTTGTMDGKMTIADDDAREETEEVQAEEDQQNTTTNQKQWGDWR